MQQKHEERKKKILQKTKKTLICIMYIKLKLMSTFTNMGDIYNNAWTEIHLCIQEFVFEKLFNVYYNRKDFRKYIKVETILSYST